MLQIRRGVDLGEEPLGADGGGEIGLEHLERHVAVVAEIPGQIDRGHAALTELALDAIAALEGGVQALNLIQEARVWSAGARIVNRRQRLRRWPSDLV